MHILSRIHRTGRCDPNRRSVCPVFTSLAPTLGLLVLVRDLMMLRQGPYDGVTGNCSADFESGFKRAPSSLPWGFVPEHLGVVYIKPRCGGGEPCNGPSTSSLSQRQPRGEHFMVMRDTRCLRSCQSYPKVFFTTMQYRERRSYVQKYSHKASLSPGRPLPITRSLKRA